MTDEQTIWLMIYLAAVSTGHRYPAQAADKGMQDFNERFSDADQEKDH
jgi:hypothetical protein